MSNQDNDMSPEFWSYREDNNKNGTEYPTGDVGTVWSMDRLFFKCLCIGHSTNPKLMIFQYNNWCHTQTHKAT